MDCLSKAGTLWLPASLFSWALLLAGCDLGGSSSSSDSEGRTADADTVPPTVLSVSPSDGDINVPRSATVSATFSEDVFAVSVDDASFTLAAQPTGNLAPGTVGLGASTDIGVFTPQDGLSLLTSYQATLAATITDQSGNALDSAFTWSFTTADGAWGSAETTNTGNLDASYFDLQTVVDAAGNTVAVWTQRNSGSDDLWASVHSAESGWATPERIDSEDADAQQVALVGDANGNALVVWRQHDGVADSVWARRYTRATGWQASPERIEDSDSDASFSSRVVQMNAGGDALVVWTQDGVKRANFFRADTGWEGAQTAMSNGAATTAVALNDQGEAMVVVANQIFFSNPSLRPVFSSAVYTPGAGWQDVATLEGLEELDAGFSIFQLSLTDNGEAIMLMEGTDRDRNFSDPAVRRLAAFSYSVTDDSWSAPEILIDGVSESTIRASLVKDADGNAMMVWQQGNNEVSAQRYTAGVGFEASTQLGPIPSVFPEELPVAGSPDGTVLVSWVEDGAIMAARHNPEAGWEPAVSIDTEDAGTSDPAKIVLDASSNGLAVWARTSGTETNLYANRFTPGAGWGEPAIINAFGSDALEMLALSVGARGTASAVWRIEDAGRQYQLQGLSFE